jgi:hypothetical protein
MKDRFSGVHLKIALIIAIILLPGVLFCQIEKGKVLSSKTREGIGYVNIAVVRKNIGTVSDESGSFALDVSKLDKNDSLRFSMVGYKSKTELLSSFSKDSSKAVYLDPAIYDLNEIKVIYHKPRIIKIGTEVTSGLGSGFGYNYLGSEFGVKMFLKRPVRLMDLNLNVSKCTFDTVKYRLNIYQSTDHVVYKNILTQPVYITFTRNQIKKPVKFDLSKYSIKVDGDILVALELYKNLGEGELFFYTGTFTDFTYHRRTTEGSWIEAGGVIGMYLHGQLLKSI